MAGKRMLHSNICESKKLSTVSYAAETLYYRLLSKSDDDGNFSAEPRVVLGQCMPFREELVASDVEKMLQELATTTNGDKMPLISLYEVRGDRYLHINRFKDFQYIRPDRTATAICPTHPEKIEESILTKRQRNGLPTSGLPPAESGKPSAESGLPPAENGWPKSNQIKLNQTNINQTKEERLSPLADKEQETDFEALFGEKQ